MIFRLPDDGPTLAGMRLLPALSLPDTAAWTSTTSTAPGSCGCPGRPSGGWSTSSSCGTRPATSRRSATRPTRCARPARSATSRWSSSPTTPRPRGWPATGCEGAFDRASRRGSRLLDARAARPSRCRCSSRTTGPSTTGWPGSPATRPRMIAHRPGCPRTGWRCSSRVTATTSTRPIPTHSARLHDQVLPASAATRSAVRGPVVGMGASLGGLAMLARATRAARTVRRAVPPVGVLSRQSARPAGEGPVQPVRAGHPVRGGGAADHARADRAHRPDLRAGRGEPGEQPADGDALTGQGYPARLVEVPDAHNYVGWRDAFDPALTDLLRTVWEA